MAMVEKSVELARGSGAPLAVFRASRGLIFACMLDARFDEARALVDEMLAEFDRSGDAERGVEPYMGARFFRGRLLVDSDGFAEAEPWIQESFALADRLKNRTMKAASAAMLASLAFIRGDYAAAERWANVALPIAEVIESLAALRSAAATLPCAQQRGDSRQHGRASTDSSAACSSGDLGPDRRRSSRCCREFGEIARA
jgi:ATP/maltotriose-dependent transcriptional regulator MalT